MWTDHETEQDFLNFACVSRTVAEIIEQARPRPVSIGVSGAWGAGKSSMIKLIRRELAGRSENQGSDFVFVEFNAWLYQGYDDARAALIEVVASSIAEEAQERRSGMDKVNDLLRRVNWFRAATLAASSIAALATGLPPVGLIGEVCSLGAKAVSGQSDQDDASEAAEMIKHVGDTASGLIKPKTKSSPPEEICCSVRHRLCSATDCASRVPSDPEC